MQFFSSIFRYGVCWGKYEAKPGQCTDTSNFSTGEDILSSDSTNIEEDDHNGNLNIGNTTNDTSSLNGNSTTDQHANLSNPPAVSKEHNRHTNVLRRQSSQETQRRLFTARPGQRVWRVRSDGTVEATLLVRDMPEEARIELPELVRDGETGVEKDPVLIEGEVADESKKFGFEKVESLDSGRLVLSSKDSLVIFNLDTLKVEAHIYKQNFFIEITSCGETVYMLTKTGELFCLSRTLPNISKDAIAPRETPMLAAPEAVARIQKEFVRRVSGLLGKIGGAMGSLGVGGALSGAMGGAMDSLGKMGGAIATSVAGATTQGEVFVHSTFC